MTLTAMPPPPAMQRIAAKRKPRPAAASLTFTSIILHVVIFVLAVISMMPFLWLVCATFKRQDDFFNYAFLPWSHPEGWTFGNYTFLFDNQPFFIWLFNSLFLASAHTCLVVTLSSLGGFALAKYRFVGKRPLMAIMLSTMLLPGQVLLTPNWELMRHLGWLDSYAAILVPSAVSVFGMLLFKQAMQTVPDELLQAGRVDGCSEIRLWWEVALPIVKPMLGAFTLLSFMGAWNSFLWPQIVLHSGNKYTLPIGLNNMIGLPGYMTPYGALMAGTLLSILPVVILFFILQRDFIAGLATGAVKG